MYIAVDFDGTVVSSSFPSVGKELPHAVDVLKRLLKYGHKLILLTNRESVVYEDENGAHNVLSEAEQWFADREISLHSVNSNSESEARFHKSRKVYADIYIDNNGLGIPKYSDGELNWYEIEKLLDTQGCFNRQLSLGI